MSSSTDKNRDRSREAFLERIKNADQTPANKREEVTDLPRWVKTALVMKAVDGMSYNEAAERLGKAGSTLANYAHSPAAKKWLEALKPLIDDPVELAKAYLRGNALSITLERLAFLEAAVAAGDYDTGDKIARDLQDRIGIVGKKQDVGPSTVVVHLGSATLEIPLGESRVIEAPKDADFEVVE